MADKYPEFYVRKRQREETYRRPCKSCRRGDPFDLRRCRRFLSTSMYCKPSRNPRRSHGSWQNERQNCDEERAGFGGGQHSTGGTAQATRFKGAVGDDLGGIPYDPSFPDVHVGIEGSSTVAPDGQLPDEAEAPAGENPAPRRRRARAPRRQAAVIKATRLTVQAEARCQSGQRG